MRTHMKRRYGTPWGVLDILDPLEIITLSISIIVEKASRGPSPY
jgi:hypothetical protein